MRKIRKTEWFNFAFLNLQSLMTLKTTASRKRKLAAKRREHKANKDEDEDYEEEIQEDDLVESMPPLVSQFPARQVGPRASPDPEPEPETGTADPPRIPSIGDSALSSVESKLYHSCREVTSQNLGNNFCTAALNFCFNGTPYIQWVNGRTAFPILRWRDE